ncbi:WecB/TagA/CpsF family glycosyltransferase [Flaviflagellibacter deserti]|uniref:WecB/TagA/CpsF family glycosyltransferase n=1 Tax=Flaviflagellibacter deserti TaxID=2267266 RepID=A0ABV9Z4I1_9HYPH
MIGRLSRRGRLLARGSRRPVGGFVIRDVSRRGLIRYVSASLETGRKVVLLFANANFIVKCQPFGESFRGSPFILVNDGVAMRIASKLLFGRAFRENLNGTDFVPLLVSKLATPQKLFLFGSTQEVVDRAARRLEDESDHLVVGRRNGFFFDDAELVAQINETGATVLLVGLGNPLQEQWIERNMGNLKPSLIVGVGALFVWLSGSQKRAPEWIRSLHLEWAYRLAKEPTRLLSRYTVGMVRFASIVLSESRSPPTHYFKASVTAPSDR